MIEAVRDFDPKTAAGILSGLALSLDRPTADPARSRWERGGLEDRIIEELREYPKLDPKDASSEAVERLAEALDEEAARIAGIEPDASVAETLGREGLLPSDAFEISYDPLLPQYFGFRWAIEQALAELTIRQPNRQQSFAPDQGDTGVSIFARYFTHHFPTRSFWLLVAGVRNGKAFRVCQIFRVYPNEVDLSKAATLEDVLEEFAERFGIEVDLNGKRAKFIKFVQSHGGQPVADYFKFPPTKGTIVISGISQALDQTASLRLAFAINMTVYFASVEARHGWDRHIRDELR